jgi:LuxR family maltose regulon positive regulatory protein
MGLLERLLHAAEDGERWGRVIATLALRAVARQTAGDVEGALADLSRALTLAEPDGYVRVFLDQGPVMGDLLRLAGTRGILPDYTRRLISELVGPAPGEPASEQPLIEPLTERELQVVRALASDLTMEEIGEELFVARSTIRSHAKSIYGKLNVHSRREAVRRARALGLFS